MAQLRESIVLLEIEQATNRVLLKEEFLITYEKLKPINLIKNKIKEVLTDPNLKSTIFNSLLGMTAGYVSKKIVVKKEDGSLKQLFGVLLQVGVTSLVSKNAESIKSTGKTILHNLFAEKEIQD